MIHPATEFQGPARAGPERIQSIKAVQNAAGKLEATFLAEMLKSAGFGEARSGFGGGAGEEQFSSFLVRAQADQMVRAGGIGLSETLFRSLRETYDDAAK